MTRPVAFVLSVAVLAAITSIAAAQQSDSAALGPGACTIHCSGDILANTDPPERGRPGCSAVVNFQAPITSGTCLPISCNPPSGSVFPLGETTVTCAEQSGPASCTFKVTVQDIEAPLMRCPAAGLITVTVGDNCLAPIPDMIANVQALDGCDSSLPITQLTTPGVLVQAGSVPVTFLAVDNAGNSGTCTYDLPVLSPDRDADGTPDCSDGCPDNPDLIAPNGCGCGMCGVGAPMMLNAVGVTLLFAKRRTKRC